MIPTVKSPTGKFHYHDSAIKFAKLECRAYGENQVTFTEAPGGSITVTVHGNEGATLCGVITQRELAALSALFHKDEALPPRCA